MALQLMTLLLVCCCSINVKMLFLVVKISPLFQDVKGLHLAWYTARELGLG